MALWGRTPAAAALLGRILVAVAAAELWGRTLAVAAAAEALWGRTLAVAAVVAAAPAAVRLGIVATPAAHCCLSPPVSARA